MVTRDATPLDEEIAALTGRSAVYALLSHALAYPNPERYAALREVLGPSCAGIETEDEGLQAALAEMLAQLETPLADLQQAHVLQFSHIVSPDCPTHETAFSVSDVFQQAQVMADIAGFYGAYGMQIGGAERERPDHIGPELEFMGWLTLKEAHASRSGRPADASECRRVQELFLQEHLGCWGPGLGGRVHQVAAHPFYRATGRLLGAWLDLEMRALDVTPQRQLDEPLPMPPPEGEEVCGESCPVDFGPADSPLIDPASIH